MVWQTHFIIFPDFFSSSLLFVADTFKHTVYFVYFASACLFVLGLLIVSNTQCLPYNRSSENIWWINEWEEFSGKERREDFRRPWSWVYLKSWEKAMRDDFQSSHHVHEARKERSNQFSWDLLRILVLP